MPVIFGLPTITFWQGVGIFILAKILFGGFNSGGSSKSDKKKKDHWDSEKMKRKFESWKHYDAWWETEGKAAFEEYTEKSDAESEFMEPKQDK
jgi:hypothetical protein